jgi:large subunit ribosomal protein L2
LCTANNNTKKKKIIHSIELFQGQGAALIRAAGTKAYILRKFQNGYVLVKLKTGEMRFIQGTCHASIGQVSNKWSHSEVVGKAGINRWLNKRPHVRGVAMNPIDHPHGGGQGKSKGGKPSVSRWNIPSKGYRTRKFRTRFILRTRRSVAKKH